MESGAAASRPVVIGMTADSDRPGLAGRGPVRHRATFLLIESTIMSSSSRILTGLVAGIAVGVFLGERAAAFSWAADAFIKLLQMTVLPYVTLSIVTGLGSLDRAQARTLVGHAGAVLAGLWGLALVYTFLIPLAFPKIQTASFFSTTSSSGRRSISWTSTSRQPVLFARQQRGPGGGPLLGRDRGCADRVEARRRCAARRCASRPPRSRGPRLAVRYAACWAVAIAASTAGTINLGSSAGCRSTGHLRGGGAAGRPVGAARSSPR